VEFQVNNNDKDTIKELAQSHPIQIPKKSAFNTNVQEDQQQQQHDDEVAATVAAEAAITAATTTTTTNNSSIEDLFYSQGNSSNNSSSNLFNQDDSNKFNKKNDLSNSILNNMNNMNNMNNINNTPDDLNQTPSTFIPKSRVNSPPINSITEAIPQANKSKYELGIPAVKRLHSKFNKYNQQQQQQQQQDFKNNETSEKINQIHRNSISNLELNNDYDNDRNYNIPKFGGFSKYKNDHVNNNNQHQNIFETSNFNIVEYSKGNGGLKNAIKSCLEDEDEDEKIIKNNDYCWVGTIGIPTDVLSENIKNKISLNLRENFNCHSILPNDLTFQGHYKNFCKQILWPTLHYQIPDNPNSKAFEDHSWEFYKILNQQFADKIIEIYKKKNNSDDDDDDIIWIHDYHLFLVPNMIRSILPNAKIGFYLHVSFPSSEVFRCFAQREILLKGLLGSNLISFQTIEYAKHFLQTCNKLLLADISLNNDEIKFNGKTIKIISSPVGIDAKKLINLQNSNIVNNWRNLISSKWGNKKLIVSRDKFDRIKGLKEKLLAYEFFLQKNPSFINKTILIQICLKSGNKNNNNDLILENEIMSIIDRINSLSPNISNSQLVIFLYQDIDFYQYLALISEADLFIVNSMREGMNLTCHEFIVANKNSPNDKKSSLILSEFTGSANIFAENAILINPWNIKQVSNSILNAINLSNDEKFKNWEKLYNIVINQDCNFWVKNNLNFIKLSWLKQQEKKNLKLNNFNKNLNFHNFYKKSEKKLFILNLSEIYPNEWILKILIKLTNIPGNKIYIFSSLKKIELERLYNRVPKLGLIAENGGFIKIHNNSSSSSSSSSWISIINEDDQKKWIKTTLKIIDSISERLPGSYVEINDCLIKFHTEQVLNNDRKNSSIGDLIFHINNLDLNIHATLINNTIIIQESNLSINSIKFLINFINDENQLMRSKIDFLTIAGNSNLIFESILEFVKDYVKNFLKIENFFTISFNNDDNSIANERVEGLNELFTIFDKLDEN